MLEYKLTRFDNGLKVITAPLKNTRAVTLLILVGAGSRFEEKSQNGISHFLEHMFFKGTKKRPKTLDIARDLDSVGAHYNAFTGEEYTGFYVRVASKHFDLALDVLSDILFESLFLETEIEKEKGTIIEEINMIKDIPQAYVDYVMKELLWGDHPLGRMITGTKETVTKFNQQDFLNYRSKFYNPKNMIIAVAGGADKSDWLGKIEKVFAKMPSNPVLGFEKAKDTQTKPQVKTFYKETDQAHLIIGFRSFKRTDERQPVLRLLNTVLGGTMSSRLFIELREKRGLCYYISSDFAEFFDTGFWGAAAGVDLKRADEALKVILQEFENIRRIEITDEELSRVKENFKGKFYLSLEESFDVAEFLAGRELFWKKIKDPDEIVAETEKVTKKDILDLAQKIFNKNNLNLALVGPYKNEEKFNKILKEFQ